MQSQVSRGASPGGTLKAGGPGSQLPAGNVGMSHLGEGEGGSQQKNVPVREEGASVVLQSRLTECVRIRRQRNIECGHIYLY